MFFLSDSELTERPKYTRGLSATFGETPAHVSKRSGVHRMDANPCACETSRSPLSHAQGFMSISLTVASEYSLENVKILKILEISS